ncbi:hypothetical protein EW145_g220 [Phellinidium pouzarii]|uniref:BTB domain-containing protein n=1 Tax=Phellinidium pouzarii TaxID=167371 RepID=A0A4S4LJ67_9AGAM|nr:hypothetical protein EW145_g220 [Phellinidium pouzarii]
MYATSILPPKPPQVMNPISAAYPFDDVSLPAEGATLKSSDGVQFKVYKNILALASPFFRDMFSLPQPESNNQRSKSPDSAVELSTSEPSLPVIDVTENKSTLDILLRMLYPLAPPSFPGISASGAVSDARALIKAIDPVLAAAQNTLPDGSVADDTLALRVFALSCRYGLKEEARAVAHASLKGRVAGVFFTGLRDMSAAQYFYLIQFQEKIVGVVESIVKTRDLPSPYDTLIKCQDCERPGECSKWWINFVHRALPILRESPKSPQIFSATFLGPMFEEATSCNHTNCREVHGKWQTIRQFIKDTIDKAITDNDIDLSEV